MFVVESAQQYSGSLEHSNGMMLERLFGIIELCFSNWVMKDGLNRKQRIGSQIEYTLSDGIIRHPH